MRIEKARFRKYLEAYRDEHVYVDQVDMFPERAEILAHCHRGRYVFSREPLSYLAGTEAILLLTQLSYVMFGLMMEMDLPQIQGKRLDVFPQKIDEGKVHLSRLEVKFRKKVEKEKDIPIRFAFKTIKKHGKTVFGKVAFDIDGGFLGTVVVVMIL